MAGKATPKPAKYQRTYIKEWREHRGRMTLAQLAARLELIGGAIAKTEASLSRIENGKQPYTQETLEAIAVALDTTPDQLIGRNPLKEGTVISLTDRLTDRQLEQAKAVIEAMIRTGNNAA